MAGLTCAVKLHEAEVPFLLIEATDKLGGRVASDRYDNFILDRGFQVLLTAYPEAKKILDYSKLGLHAFYQALWCFVAANCTSWPIPFDIL